MATTEAPAEPLHAPLRFEVGLRGWALLKRGVTHRWLVWLVLELSALATLGAAIFVVFWPHVLGVGVYAESDTFTFFYPVYATLHASLNAGELPLWTPYLFGGFPLFAEGQIGALYPPSYVATQLLSPIEGFLLLRVFHIGVAVAGAYLLARTLGVSPAGATIGGLAFGLGSFIVAQQHHANLLAAAVWIPLLLACVEKALQLQGWHGHALIGLSALLLGLEALATHVQPLMLTGALLVAYVLVRQTWMALRALRRPGGLKGVGICLLLVVDALAIVVFISVVGALIAAAQLLPLYELSQESWRAAGWSYRDAVEYSLPPINLITLVFPFFFRGPQGGQWSLWQTWEAVLYVGVVPLILALVGALAVRRWAVTFFALAAAVSTVVALGGYAPYSLYETLWQIPGMNLQRAPARFSSIATLSLAMLAAYGADWLAVAASAAPSRARRRLLLVQVGILALLATVLAHLVVWRGWLQSDRAWAMELLGKTYLAQANDPLQTLDPLSVVHGLDNSLDLANPKTALPLGILGGLALLLVAWRELPRAVSLWRVLLIALVVADLTVFASDFHPLVDVRALGDVGPAGRLLIEKSGEYRVLTRPEVEAPQPNELLPSEVSEAAGYSPLELERHLWYARSVQTIDDSLLDLWGVRYIVDKTHPDPLPSYQLVSFHPRQPLLFGGAGTPNGQIKLQPEPVYATQLRMVAGLSGGEAVLDGETIGEWLVTDSNGVRYVLPVRAGIEIGEWRQRVPGFKVAHRPIQTATTISVGDSISPTRVLGYAELPLPDRVLVTSLEYRHINAAGRTVLYGAALYDPEDDSTSQVRPESRYLIAYRDPAVTIYENTRAYPRAFVVPEAVLASDAPTAMVRLRESPLDPRRQVVIESQPDIGLGPFRGTAPLDASIVAEGTAALDISASAPGGGFLVLTDAYYPGWQAYVDGVATPILRADYLFRAVPLPPGDHTVSFRFEPTSLQHGIWYSLLGVTIAVGAAVIGVLVPLLIGGTRLAWRLWRRRRGAQMT